MQIFSHMRRLGAALGLCWATLAIPGHAYSNDELYDDLDDAPLEALQHEDIPVDQRIFHSRWHRAPFAPQQFDYTPQQMARHWDELMVGIRAPFPTPELLQTLIERYPELVSDTPAFTGDYQAFSDALIHVWRLFLRGDFQQAREQGLQLGLFGFYPAMFAQTLYAIYLSDRQSEKYMMLQDVANRARDHLPLLERAQDDPDAAEFVAFARLGYAYAIARIAEESPVPVIVFRRYIGKIKDGADDVLAAVPEHPLGHTFLAAVDAGIMRRVGRAAGRLTYGARTAVVEQSFQRAFALAPQIPILNYEYANAVVYLGRRQDLPKAHEYFNRATAVTPRWSMDALDVLYARQRQQEIQLMEDAYPSFRSFERQRRRFTRVTDHNLTNVLTPVLTLEQLQHPERYRLD